jgi:NAD(P) transhydrogenase subunit alpha
VIIGVPKETLAGERRVALVPAAIAPLKKAGHTVQVERGAGEAAGFLDQHYEGVGAEVVPARDALFGAADVVLQVRALGANPAGWTADLQLCRDGQTLVAMMEPLGEPGPVPAAAGRGVTTFALELMPRITRAQSMDVLSSQANLAGYKAVLMAAGELPKILPMMITAAGTITPARVFVVGAGVAGLQAIATAKRLGGVVSAYDVRPAVKEQVESVGARFVELEIPAEGAEGGGGYARAMGADFYQRQAELMLPVVAESDIVITTAAIPGQKAPVLISRAMVDAMRPGAVVVDLAAERGGNCELTRPGETVIHQGVTIMGPLNVPSSLPYNASQLYAKNVTTFLAHLTREGAVAVDREDEITRETLLTWNGEVVNARVRERLGLPPLPAPVATAAAAG